MDPLRGEMIGQNFPQIAPQYFSCGTDGHFLHQFQTLRHLETCDFSVFEKRLQLLQRQSVTASKHDNCTCLFNENVIGDRDDAHGLDRRMRQKMVLDLCAADLFASPIDEVLDPTFHVKIAVPSGYDVAGSVDLLAVNALALISGEL